MKISKYIHVQRSKSWISSPWKTLLRCFDNINGNKCDHLKSFLINPFHPYLLNLTSVPPLNFQESLLIIETCQASFSVASIHRINTTLCRQIRTRWGPFCFGLLQNDENGRCNKYLKGPSALSSWNHQFNCLQATLQISAPFTSSLVFNFSLGSPV